MNTYAHLRKSKTYFLPRYFLLRYLAPENMYLYITLQRKTQQNKTEHKTQIRFNECTSTGVSTGKIMMG